MPASAAAATAELTPGTTSKPIPAAASANASSPPRPSTKGSPHFRRTTRRPRRAARTIRRLIVSWRIEGRPARFPTGKRRARGASSSSARIDERVVEHEVGRGENARAPARQQLRIAGTRPHQPHEPAHDAAFLRFS